MAYTLPDLPYGHDALEPHIDAKTMADIFEPYYDTVR